MGVRVGVRVRLNEGSGIERNGFKVVVQAMKQELEATSQRIKRFSEKVRQHTKNRMFVNNQRILSKPNKGKQRQGRYMG